MSKWLPFKYIPELFRLTVSFPCAIRDTEPIHRVWAGKITQNVELQILNQFDFLPLHFIGPFPLFFLYTVEAFEVYLN